MNKLIAQERAATTTTARLGFIKQMELLGAKDLPTIPYWQGNMIVVGRSNIGGIDSTIDATYYMRFWLLSKS